MDGLQKGQQHVSLTFVAALVYVIQYGRTSNTVDQVRLMIPYIEIKEVKQGEANYQSIVYSGSVLERAVNDLVPK